VLIFEGHHYNKFPSWRCQYQFDCIGHTAFSSSVICHPAELFSFGSVNLHLLVISSKRMVVAKFVDMLRRYPNCRSDISFWSHFLRKSTNWLWTAFSKTFDSTGSNKIDRKFARLCFPFCRSEQPLQLSTVLVQCLFLLRDLEYDIYVICEDIQHSWWQRIWYILRVYFFLVLLGKSFSRQSQ